VIDLKRATAGCKAVASADVSDFDIGTNLSSSTKNILKGNIADNTQFVGINLFFANQPGA
jgi:parallel beta-helix repeat protein